MDHYEIQKGPQTPAAVSALLEAIDGPVDLARGPHDRDMRIYHAAKRVRQAQAEDEYLSWQPVKREMSRQELFAKYAARGAR